MQFSELKKEKNKKTKLTSLPYDQFWEHVNQNKEVSMAF